MKKLFFALVICLFFCLFHGYSQSDCISAVPVCINASNEVEVSNYGNDDFNGRTQSGCLGQAGAVTVESNSYWFRIKMAESGQFGFDIISKSSTDDWDFAVYGPNKTCGSLPDPIKCNIGIGSGSTGVGDASNLYDSWMTVNAGEEYFILVNNYTGTNAGFSINWTGSIFTPGNDVLDCDIELDLGPDLNLCGNEQRRLYANVISNGNDIRYEWLKLNNTTGLYETWTTSDTIGTHQVTQAGSYGVKVYVTDPSTGNIINTYEDYIEVQIYPQPIANQIPDLVFCADGTGIYNFSLGSVTNDINNSPGVTVEYYESRNRAIRGWEDDILTGDIQINSGVTTTLWARAVNAGDCYEITSFNVTALPPPIAYQAEDLIQCDTDLDGKYIFNLEDQTEDILKGQPNLIVTYYISQSWAEVPKFEIFNPNISDPADAPPPTPPSTSDAYLSESRTIWARVEPTLGSDCYALTSFNLKVVAPAKANQPENLNKCDDDNDGIYEFDLTEIDDDILGTQDASNFEINYFETQADAENNNIDAILPNPYPNKDPINPETIWARIQVKGNSTCFELTSFEIQVYDSALPAMQDNFPDLTYCDDDDDGFYTFDLTEKETDVLGINVPLFDVTYYTKSDRLPSSQIPNPKLYTNDTSDYLPQTIYVKIINKQLLNETEQCEFDTTFNIEVLKLPDAKDYVLVQCGAATNALGTIFNLAEADFYVANEHPENLTITYHLLQSDANSTSVINELDKYPFSDSTSSVVYARVANNNCYKVVEVKLTVSETPLAFLNFPILLSECDDDGIIDGKRSWNLSALFRNLIRNQFPLITNLRIAYYKNEEDALSETNFIDPNYYVNDTPKETIWVRVESSTDGGCAGIAPVIQLTVNPRPEFDLDETGVVCLNNPLLSVSTYNANDIYTYKWTDENGNLVSQQPTADITQAGIYTVIATSIVGRCKSFPKQITITESNSADISPDDIQINDNSTNNSITIITDNQNLGIGDYEFALDDRNGPYQDSPTFLEVIPGEHTVYVREKNECGIAQATIYLFGFPNFFTPNNDGENDTWNVLGVDASVFLDSKIFIYDRYGKMLANFNATQLGWDGMYNNNKAISSDYWYFAQMVDINGNIREYKGHFSLIRR